MDCRVLNEIVEQYRLMNKKKPSKKRVEKEKVLRKWLEECLMDEAKLGKARVELVRIEKSCGVVKVSERKIKLKLEKADKEWKVKLVKP